MFVAEFAKNFGFPPSTKHFTHFRRERVCVNTTSKTKHLRRAFASWSRWLHIYLSMFGLAVILFFSITGFTLNHPDWFFVEHTQGTDGQLDSQWLNNGSAPPSDWDLSDTSYLVSKLEVAEYLRGQHRLQGSVSAFVAFDDECEVTFEAPGYAATARIERASGKYHLDITANDLVTVMNDLHKGRHTGYWWSLLIDASAIIGTLVGLTGFALVFFLRLKRTTGIVTALIGAVLLWGIYRTALYP